MYNLYAEEGAAGWWQKCSNTTNVSRQAVTLSRSSLSIHAGETPSPFSFSTGKSLIRYISLCTQILSCDAA